MRTNKACPMYTGLPGSSGAAMSSQADTIDDVPEKPVASPTEDLVNVDGTKIKLSSKVMKVKKHRNLYKQHLTTRSFHPYHPISFQFPFI